ncbi:MAG: LytTR family DNA-binding domain-containing protein [Phocaeicola sp.]|nr:LytTR family DNA-binding domain-containing protein [Phocaeicola sp.]
MILKCAIVDDEPLALELLKSYVKKTPVLELNGAYSSAIEAMKMLPDNPVDLLFLDIQMPELNGLEFSHMVPEDTRIVFTTAFGQYALDGYKVNALDYLLKPISYTDFLQSVNKAVQWFDRKRGTDNEPTDKPDFIYVKSDYKLIQISLKDILYIEGLKDYVKIHLEGESRPILSLTSLKALEEKLPTDRFIRVHRSYIVQKQKIRVIDKARIVFGKEYIPVSESYKQELQNYINDHSV